MFNIILVLLGLFFVIASAVGASSVRAENHIYDVQAFFKNSKFSQLADLEFVTTEEDVPIIVLFD
tara:strand:+ start:988 stop:1182 length:195 start_codon:yes stop_codon:yes gene_type:complete